MLDVFRSLYYAPAVYFPVVSSYMRMSRILDPANIYLVQGQ